MKSSKTVIVQRQKDILGHLEQNQYVKIAELAEKYQVSVATMRRDIAELEKCGKVIVRLGGVELTKSYDNLPNFDSEPFFMSNGLEKEAIAKYAATLLDNGDSVFLNSSSTAQRILKYIGDKNLTIITNNGRTLNDKRGSKTELVIIGGQVGASYSNGIYTKTSMTGDFAVDMISKINATKCVIGVSGISVNGGLTSLAIQDPAVNKEMIKHCNGPVIVVADHRKIGVRHNYYFGSIHEVTHLITDSKSDPIEIRKIRDAGIEVFVVDVDE